jgi:hypothetical protein
VKNVNEFCFKKVRIIVILAVLVCIFITHSLTIINVIRLSESLSLVYTLQNIAFVAMAVTYSLPVMFLCSVLILAMEIMYRTSENAIDDIVENLNEEIFSLKKNNSGLREQNKLLKKSLRDSEE